MREDIMMMPTGYCHKNSACTVMKPRPCSTPQTSHAHRDAKQQDGWLQESAQVCGGDLPDEL